MNSTTTIEQTKMADSEHQANDQSSAERKAPRLSPRGLSWTLLVMVMIPTATVLTLWYAMPPVFEGKLEAEISAVGLPPADFYMVRYDLRPPYVGGQLVLHNNSDVDWTQLNIQVNKFYQIHDIEPIPAGQSRTYDMERFLTRTGARFQLQFNQLKSARVYARRPTRDRATFARTFETVPEE